jgi:hypothetical protein
MMAKVLGLAVAAVLLGSAQAAELSRGVHDVTAIVHQSGAGRLLFKVDLPRDLGAVAVKQATLRVPVRRLEGQIVPEAALDLRLDPITRPWMAGAVDWYAGWERPGGDFQEDLFANADVPLNRDGVVQFDVTMIVKEVLEKGMEDHGFLVTVPPDVALGLGADEREAFANIGGSSLEVRYRTTPARRARS